MELEWYLGEVGDGKSCNEICAEHGRTCYDEDLCIATKTELTNICNSRGFAISTSEPGTWSIRPMYHAQNNECYGFGDCTGLTCAATSTNGQTTRICHCSGSIPTDII